MWCALRSKYGLEENCVRGGLSTRTSARGLYLPSFACRTAVRKALSSLRTHEACDMHGILEGRSCSHCMSATTPLSLRPPPNNVHPDTPSAPPNTTSCRSTHTNPCRPPNTFRPTRGMHDVLEVRSCSHCMSVANPVWTSVHARHARCRGKKELFALRGRHQPRLDLSKIHECRHDHAARVSTIATTSAWRTRTNDLLLLLGILSL